MSFITVLLLSVALAMDCLAVSISQSACLKAPAWDKWVVMALCFAAFQGVMPLIGFYAMYFFAESITAYDHWIAFIILGVLGVRMIKEDLVKKEDVSCACEEKSVVLSFGQILLLSIATSIDALATGIIFVPFPNWLYVAVLCIGVVSFLFSIAGSQMGYYLGKRFAFKWGLLGGLILIAIGTKILIEHTCFS